MKPAQPAPVSPALLRNLQGRSKRRQNGAADEITRFAGSMRFVYLHCVWFGAWILLRVEHYPVRPVADERLTGGDLPVDVS